MPTQIHEPHTDVTRVMHASRELEVQGQLEAALNLYRSWLKVHPNEAASIMCWYEYGRLLQITGAFQKAESAFRAALEQNPKFTEGALALGKSLEAQGKLKEAIEVWDKAMPPQALQIQLFNNMARLHDQLHSVEEAEAALIHSLRLDPTQDSVITTLLQQRQKLCRWPVITPDIGVSKSVQKANVGPLMSLALFDNPKENLTSVKNFLKSKNYFSPSKTLTRKGALYPGHGKLRVGFLSADFRLHATSIFFSPLIEYLDRNLFEIYLLDMTVAADPFPFARQRLMEVAEHHIPLQAMDDEAAARTIQSLEIDVLVDLAGLTAGARPGIVAMRPAPIQMTYIGFLASCGIPNMDYIVTTADMFVDACANGFTEKPLKLAGTYVAFTNDGDVSTGSTRSSCGLPEDAVVYCALLNTYKITPEMFACWMAILKGVPNSVLWLVEENPTTRKNLEQHALDHGVSIDRLRFSQRVHPAEYRTRLAMADLFLDSSPYGNGATTRDVLLANLPILTKPGKTMMSRLTAHMVGAMGMAELIVDSLDDYVAKAVQLGLNRNKLASMKQEIAAAKHTSPLFKTEEFAKHFGEAILQATREMSS